MVEEPATPAEAVGARIRARREALDGAMKPARRMRQADLAKALRRDTSWVSRAERGQVYLNVTDLTEIAFQLDVDPATLIRGLLPKGRRRRRRGTGKKGSDPVINS